MAVRAAVSSIWSLFLGMFPSTSAIALLSAKTLPNSIYKKYAGLWHVKR